MSRIDDDEELDQIVIDNPNAEVKKLEGPYSLLPEGYIFGPIYGDAEYANELREQLREID